MKKKSIAIISLAAVGALIVPSAVACGNSTPSSPPEPPIHEHTYSDAWESDASGHWHKANCGHDVISDVLGHEYVGGVCKVCTYAELDAFEYERVSGGHKITALKDKSATRVSIPDSIKEIAADVFKDSDLERVDIWNVKAWLDIDFENSQSNPLYRAKALYLNDSPVVDLVVPDGVTQIKNYAFYGYDALNSVKLSDSVETVGANAFYDCNGIVRLELGKGLNNIGIGAFTGDRRLVEVYNYSSLDISEYSFAKNALRVETSATDSALKKADGGFTFYSLGSDKYLVKYDGETTDVVLPSACDGGAYTVRAYAFYDNKYITSIDIGDGVTAVGNGAFYNNTALRTVTVGANVAKIDNNAFMYCDALGTVYNNSALDIVKGATTHGGIAEKAHFVFSKGNLNDYDYTTSLGDYSFAVKNGNYYLTRYNGSAVELVLPDSINGHDYAIADAAFKDIEAAITSVVVSDGVTAIGAYAFSDQAQLAQVTLGNNVKTIGAYAFYGTGITEIRIPDSVTYIDGLAFYDCEFGDAMEYTYEDNVWYIGSTANPYLLVKAVVAPSDGSALELNAQTKAIAATAFYACTADVIIPDGVEVIGTYAFYGYQGKSLTLGDGIKKIEDDAFRSCRSILQVNVGSMETWLDIEYANRMCNPLSCKDSTELYINGVKLGENLVIDSGITKIKAFAFYGCCQIKTVEIGGTVTEIGERAFESCKSLQSIVIGGSVKTIGNYAFKANVGSASLTALTLGEGIMTIGDSAFGSHGALTEVVIPASVVSIGKQAFYSCKQLTSVEFKNTEGWQRSKTADFSGEVEQIESSALIDKASAARLLTAALYYWKRG